MGKGRLPFTRRKVKIYTKEISCVSTTFVHDCRYDLGLVVKLKIATFTVKMVFRKECVEKGSSTVATFNKNMKMSNIIKNIGKNMSLFPFTVLSALFCSLLFHLPLLLPR